MIRQLWHSRRVGYLFFFSWPSLFFILKLTNEEWLRQTLLLPKETEPHYAIASLLPPLCSISSTTSLYAAGGGVGWWVAPERSWHPEQALISHLWCMMSFPCFSKPVWFEDYPPVDTSPPCETDKPTHLCWKNAFLTHYLRTCEPLNKYTDGGFLAHAYLNKGQLYSTPCTIKEMH